MDKLDERVRILVLESTYDARFACPKEVDARARDEEDVITAASEGNRTHAWHQARFPEP